MTPQRQCWVCGAWVDADAYPTHERICRESGCQACGEPSRTPLCTGCADTVAGDWLAFDLGRALHQLGMGGAS